MQAYNREERRSDRRSLDWNFDYGGSKNKRSSNEKNVGANVRSETIKLGCAINLNSSAIIRIAWLITTILGIYLFNAQGLEILYYYRI